MVCWLRESWSKQMYIQSWEHNIHLLIGNQCHASKFKFKLVHLIHKQRYNTINQASGPLMGNNFLLTSRKRIFSSFLSLWKLRKLLNVRDRPVVLAKLILSVSLHDPIFTIFVSYYIIWQPIQSCFLLLSSTQTLLFWWEQEAHLPFI